MIFELDQCSEIHFVDHVSRVQMQSNKPDSLQLKSNACVIRFRPHVSSGEANWSECGGGFGQYAGEPGNHGVLLGPRKQWVLITFLMSTFHIHNIFRTLQEECFLYLDIFYCPPRSHPVPSSSAGSRGEESSEEDPPIDITTVQDMLSSHHYKSFKISMIHKLRFTTDVQLGTVSICNGCMPVRAVCKPHSPDLKKRRSSDWR